MGSEQVRQDKLENCEQGLLVTSAGFTYRLARLKPRVSKFRGAPAKVYNIFDTVIGRSHLCCHNVLYFLNNPSVIFLTHLHSISEYCRILNTHYHIRLYSSRESGKLGGASQVEWPRASLYLNPAQVVTIVT